VSTYGRYSRTQRVKRWVRLHATGNRQRARNWLNRRARARGKAPLPDRITRAVGSRVPVYRDRISPATGRPRWTDRSDGALTRWRASRPGPIADRDLALTRALARRERPQGRPPRTRGRSR
jgi:hypothetical protein